MKNPRALFVLCLLAGVFEVACEFSTLPGKDLEPPVDDAGPSDAALTVPRVEVLTSPLCEGQRLDASNELVRLANREAEVWHICYLTPPAATSLIAGSPAERFSRVNVYRFNPVSGVLVELAQASAPNSADPWTAEFLIALPPGTPPYFNLANVPERAMADFFWASQENPPPAGSLGLNGQIQVWRVYADGTQAEARVSVLCRDPDTRSTIASRGFFIPDIACTEERPEVCSPPLLECVFVYP